MMFQLRSIFALLLSLIFLKNGLSEKSTIKNEDRCYQYPQKEGEGIPNTVVQPTNRVGTLGYDLV